MYDIIGKIRLFYSYCLTKILYPNARLIRQPFDIRNSKYIKIGKNFTTGFGCRLEAYPKKPEIVIFIGDNVQINDYVHIAAHEKIIIEDDVLIASKVFITDLNHGNYNEKREIDIETKVISRELEGKNVIIQKNVWLGENVSILPGVIIGENSIIGAGSVVTKSVPKNSIAVGNPAKVIKIYNTKLRIWERIR